MCHSLLILDQMPKTNWSLANFVQSYNTIANSKAPVCRSKNLLPNSGVINLSHRGNHVDEVICNRILCVCKRHLYHCIANLKQIWVFYLLNERFYSVFNGKRAVDLYISNIDHLFPNRGVILCPICHRRSSLSYSHSFQIFPSLFQKYQRSARIAIFTWILQLISAICLSDRRVI